MSMGSKAKWVAHTQNVGQITFKYIFYGNCFNVWCSNVPVLGFHLCSFLRFGGSASKTSPGNQGITPAHRGTQCTMSTITVEYVYVL